ncbi:MAG: type II secretion system protein [Syntrophomonas sp.]
MKLLLKNIKSERNLEKGTTLLEVLVALVILAVLTTAVLAIFMPTGLWISKARNETTAANYAAAILEDLRDQRSRLQTGNSISPEDLGLDQQYKPDFPVGINASISMESMASYSKLYKVQVLVKWKEGIELRKITMATLMRKV